MFDDIIGNSQVKNYLSTMIKKNAIGNSFLFAGIEGIGKSLFAEALAKLVLKVETLKNQPDVHIYRPEGKIGMHSIDSMRHMCEKVYLAPFSSDRKVFIIHNAEKMLPTSANSLLKTFEEPSPDTIMILLSSNPNALLPTVLSRCRTIRFHHIPEDEISHFLTTNFKKTTSEAKQLASLSGGSLGKAIRLCENESDLIRNQLIELLSKGKVKFYSEIISASKSTYELIEEIKKQEEIAVKTELTKDYNSDLTALQLQHLNKGIDGAVSLRQSDFALAVFEVILSWTRDLHLLKNGGHPSYLINADCLEKLQINLKTGKFHSIESVQKMIGEAKLLLERSTSLNIVLENLFLKLELI